MTTDQRSKKTLFGQIMLWMLAPLIVLWPISLFINYELGRTIADTPFDQTLEHNVMHLSQQMQNSHGQHILSTSDLILPDSEDVDKVYYQVRFFDGEVLIGNVNIPSPPAINPKTVGQVFFYNAYLNDNPIRVSYMWQDLSSPLLKNKYLKNNPIVLIQVAETLHKRQVLARKVLLVGVLQQLVFLMIAVSLIWFGLARGIAPLSRLQQQVLKRRHDDVSNLPATDAPEEMMPLIHSFNHLLYRLRRYIAFQKQFLADTAHQIKTPLAGLKAQAELALQTQDIQQQRESLAQIAAASDRTAHLASQLIALARTEHLIEQNLPLKSMSLIDTAREQLLQLVDYALQKGLQVSFEAPDHDIWIKAHPMMIGELFKNIISNAINYANSSLNVRISCHLEQAFFEVFDDGPGIPKAEREQVYVPFYSVLDEYSNGSGLGLTIVKQVADMHHAQTHIRDNDELIDAATVGCVFCVEFNAVPPPEVLEEGQAT